VAPESRGDAKAYVFSLKALMLNVAASMQYGNPSDSKMRVVHNPNARVVILQGNDDGARPDVDFGLEWLFGFNSRILRTREVHRSGAHKRPRFDHPHPRA
jgi:hypothetical protein